jgi:hypothetical protein
MPMWLRAVLGIVGGLIVLAALWVVGKAGIDFWRQAHPPHTLMEKSGQVLELILARLTGGIVGLFLGGWLVQLSMKKPPAPLVTAAAQLAKVTTATTSMAAAAPAPVKRAARKRWQSANVLEVGNSFRKLWGFNAGRRGFTLSQEHSLAESDPLPAKMVARNWRSLFQPRLNVAWLPADQVFLRVAQLPVGDFDETLQMVELQLEKLSPLPVTQICWNIHILPGHVNNLQTIIITIVGRDIVQKYLGELEAQGYLADRLELPMVDQLQATPITGDGAWVYPGPDATRFSALVAWWYGGVLRNLALLHVAAADNRNELFKEQITQMAWAGELEGWLIASPHWHLVADEATAANWLPLFQAATGSAPEIIQPLVDSDLAALTANRAAHASPRSNILPPEFAARYHSQFVDRLWMRGVGAVIVGYLAAVMIYMAIASVQNYRADGVEMQMRNLSGSYTNTLKLKAKLQILQDRKDLKNAALDTWKITAELLPEGLTIQSLELKNGKSFNVFGAGPHDGQNAVDDFNDAMRKIPLGGHSFFAKMETPIIHTSPGGVSWSFGGEVDRAEEGP